MISSPRPIHLTLYLLALSLFLLGNAASDRPNIVLVIADDMGYSDIGSYGGEIETPRLDALADGSATGGFHPDLTTLPEALKTAGYATFMSGKWHLSDPNKPHGPNAPHKRGFDRSYSTYHGTTDFFAPADLNLNGENKEHEWRNRDDYYQTDAITDYALKFIDEHDAKKATAQKPFFLYVSYNAAHWPLHAKPEDIEHYKGRYAMGWDALRKQRYERMKDFGVIEPDWQLSPRDPVVPAWKDEEHQAWQQRRMEVYAAQITCMDRNIGRIVDQLKDSGKLDNTIFIYQHDNGGCHVEYPPERTGSWTKPFTTDGKNRPIRPGNLPDIMPGDQSTWQSYGYGWANVSNTPFRLFKQHDHEGGTRSPLIMSWPAGLDRKLTGGLTKEICHTIDLMPTLVEAAGGNPVAQKPLPIEGLSFYSVLKAKPENRQIHDAIYWAHSKGKAIRVGDWKLVSENKRPWELYNLADDPTELANLASAMPEKAKALERQHTQWAKRTDLSANSPK